MIPSTKVLTTLSFLTVVFLVFGSASFAGDLDGHGLAYDGWTGSSAYSNVYGLAGTIDYSVFTADNFVAGFPGAAPDYVPGDALVYAYQVNNDGGFAVLAQIVGISSVANTIGAFEYSAGEVAPSYHVFDSGGNAVWGFTNPNIGTGESSYILAFSSEKIPVMGSSASVTVDGGTVAITDVPTPGPVSIPEPASVVLLAAGLLSIVMVTRRRR